MAISMPRVSFLCAILAIAAASSHPPAAQTTGGLAGMAPVTPNPKQNAILKLEVTEAGFAPANRPAPPGRRYYTVGVRGMSRSASAQIMGGSKGDDVLVDVRRFVFAQNERGCISRPERDVTGVPNLIGDAITFSPTKPVEGRLVFLVPDDTSRIRVLIAPAGADALAVPAGADFTPSWPAPQQTIDDGSTLRVLVLPRPAPRSTFPPPAAGLEHVVLDVVIQNLKDTQGIEFQTSQQLRMVDAKGKFIQASVLTNQLGCRLDDGDVIPPGHARRLMLVFDVPAGAARRLQYRGFEKDEVIVDVK